LLAHSLLREAASRYIHDSNNLETTWAMLKRHKDDTGSNARIVLDASGNMKIPGSVYNASGTKIYP